MSLTVLWRSPKRRYTSLFRGRTLSKTYRRLWISLRMMFALFAWKTLKNHTIQKEEETVCLGFQTDEFLVVMCTTQTASLNGSIAATLALFAATISPVRILMHLYV